MVTSGTNEAQELLKKIDKAGIELFLWRGTIVWDPKARLGKAIAMELPRLLPQIKRLVAHRVDLERSKPGLPHKWLLRRGDKTSPGYLACGPSTWYERCLRAARLFGRTEEEIARWVILEQDQIGLIVKGQGDYYVASQISLPEGSQPAAPEGVETQIVSVCDVCLHPGVEIDGIDFKSDSPEE